MHSPTSPDRQSPPALLATVGWRTFPGSSIIFFRVRFVGAPGVQGRMTLLGGSASSRPGVNIRSVTDCLVVNTVQVVADGEFFVSLSLARFIQFQFVSAAVES